MNSTAKYAVGDKGILRVQRTPDYRDAEIMKVARKWMWVAYGRYRKERMWIKVDASTGYIDGAGYASPGRFLTFEQEEVEERKRRLLASLREFGWEPVLGNSANFSINLLERLVDTICSFG